VVDVLVSSDTSREESAQLGGLHLRLSLRFIERGISDKLIFGVNGASLFRSGDDHYFSEWCARPDALNTLRALVGLVLTKVNRRHPALKLSTSLEDDGLHLKLAGVAVVGKITESLDLTEDLTLFDGLSTQIRDSFSRFTFDFEVEPKIGWRHFLSLYVYAKSADKSFPNESVETGDPIEDLAVFAVLRFIQILRVEIQAGLYPGYKELHGEDLPFLRGALRPLPFALNVSQGRLGFVCDYEEFGLDTPVNRVLKQAALKSLAILQTIHLRAQAHFYESEINQLLHWIESDFEEVGIFDEQDLIVPLPTRQESLAASHRLAKEIIQNHNINLDETGSRANELVISGTDALMEAALIAVLAYSLSDLGNAQVFSMSSRKISDQEQNRFKREVSQVPPVPWQRQGWKGSGNNGWAFQPDICIHDSSPGKECHVIGDVKYYRPANVAGTISDSVRYQSLYFMAVYEIIRGMVLNFADSEGNGDQGKHIIPPSVSATSTTEPWAEMNSTSGVRNGLCLWVVSWNCDEKSPAKAFRRFQEKILEAYADLLNFGQ